MSLARHEGVEDVVDGVSDEIDAEHSNENCNAREHRHPPVLLEKRLRVADEKAEAHPCLIA